MTWVADLEWQRIVHACCCCCCSSLVVEVRPSMPIWTTTARTMMMRWVYLCVRFVRGRGCTFQLLCGDTRAQRKASQLRRAAHLVSDRGHGQDVPGVNQVAHARGGRSSSAQERRVALLPHSLFFCYSDDDHDDDDAEGETGDTRAERWEQETTGEHRIVLATRGFITLFFISLCYSLQSATNDC